MSVAAVIGALRVKQGYLSSLLQYLLKIFSHAQAV